MWSTLKAPNPDEQADYDAIQVEVDTLDNLACSFDLQNDILIKIDTEGFDLEVIRGGQETLRRSAAVVIEASLYPTTYGKDSPVFEDILTALSELGFCYRGTIRSGYDRGALVVMDALFVQRSVAKRLTAA